MNQQSHEKLSSLVIVLLNYCSADDTISNVKHLLSFNRPYHIVVVDNSSPDGSYTKLKSFFKDSNQVDILRTGANLGYAAGNNYGIRYAAKCYDIETIAVINPDVTIPSSEIIEKLCTLLYSDEKCIFAGGCPLNHCNNDEPMPMGWDIPSASEIFLNSSLFAGSPDEKHQQRCMQIKDGIYRVECIAGCFFVAKYSLFKKIGFFDEGTFLYNEENILGIKAREAGYYGLVDSKLNYYHNHTVKKEPVMLKNKLTSIDVGFKSRVYLAQTYYSKFVLPLLYLTHILNKFFLLLAWLKHKFIASTDRMK